MTTNRSITRAPRLPRRSRPAHNRWLILNLLRFNFAGGWSQLIARQQTQPFTR
jgi:hypothetical protein